MWKPSELHRRGRVSPLLLVLLGGFFLLGASLIVVIGLRPSNKSAEPGNGGAVAKPAKLAMAQAGEVVTRDKLTNPVTPSKAADTGRIAATYQAGRNYRSLLKVSVEARASDKDWGVTTDMNFRYVGEGEIIRHIVSNDGTTLVLTQEFTRARTVAVFTKIEGIHIDLGPVGQTIIEGAGILAGLPPGWSKITTTLANETLNNDIALQLINQARQDPSAEIRGYIDSLQGKKCKVTYVNGKGVESVEPVGCELTGDEQTAVFATCMVSDVYILPDLQCKVGDTWTVYGEDFLPIVDPSLRASLSGKLTARRGADGGTPQRPTAEVSLDQGILTLHDADGSTDALGQWAPHGKMTFSFADKIVTQADLGGDILIESHSTDHILFEARYSVQPKYRIMYSCEFQP